MTHNLNYNIREVDENTQTEWSQNNNVITGTQIDNTPPSLETDIDRIREQAEYEDRKQRIYEQWAAETPSYVPPEQPYTGQATLSFAHIERFCLFKIVGWKKLTTEFGPRLILTLGRWGGTGVVGEVEDRFAFPRLYPWYAILDKTSEAAIKRKDFHMKPDSDCTGWFLSVELRPCDPGSNGQYQFKMKRMHK